MRKNEIIRNNNTTYNNQLLCWHGGSSSKLISDKEKVPKRNSITEKISRRNFKARNGEFQVS